MRTSRPRSKDIAVKVAALVSSTCAAEEDVEEEAEMEQEEVDVAAVKRTLKEAAEIFGDATEVPSHESICQREPGASITTREEPVPVKQEAAVQEVSEVARWLDENSLGHLLEILDDNGIDFEALKLMEKSDMMEMCGLKMGDRLKLWKAKQLDPRLSDAT